MLNAGSRGVDILFVISALRTGGTERQVAMLTSELAKLGCAVAVYSLIDGDVRAQIERSGIEVILPPGARGRDRPSKVTFALLLPVAAAHLYWLMLTRRPRIVHFFLPAAYLVGAPLAVLARVPVRVMSRRSLNVYQGIIVRELERLLHRFMHAVLGNSRSVIAQLKGEGIPANRLGLIYNGIDAAAFANGSRHESRKRLNLPGDALVLSIVANLYAYKGHRDLIEALALAAPQLPSDWRLIMVGRDEGAGANLKDQVVRLGLKGHIAFTGARGDVAEILAASDIGILCSHEEGFANAILEGMAAGLPMVVTDIGGNIEAVTDGVTGLVVPARDPRRLAAAIVKLANDASLRVNFGVAGRERVTRDFSVQRATDDHAKLYAALRAGKRPAEVPEICVPN